MELEQEVREVPEREWSSALKRETTRIQRWSAVQQNSINVVIDGTELIRIKFNFLTDILVEPTPTPIQDIEPVAFVYASVDRIGLDAPAIWSMRSDFPRDIGHINATPVDHPASICLARAGLQAIYDRFGVDGMLDRMTDWFHDAKTGQLMKDGWEPVPMGVDQDLRSGCFDIGTFQQIAFNQTDDAHFCCGEARLLVEELGESVVFLAPPLNLDDANQVQVVTKRITERASDEGVKMYIPWVYLRSNRNQPIDKQIFSVWNRFGELEAGLADAGIDGLLPTAIMDVLMRLTGESSRPVGLLIGIWRPANISETIFGLAAEPIEARSLEIQGYLIRCDQSQENPIDAGVQVQQLLGMQLPNREMLSFTSGISEIPPIALLGCGALGSSVADLLVRAGVKKIAAIDKDTIEPHNLARHAATVDDLYSDKVTHLQKQADKLTFHGGEISSNPIKCNIASINKRQFSSLSGEYPILVDSTADERIRRYLSSREIVPESTLLRVEMFNKGQLGVLFRCGTENKPNLIDLYYHLCVQAIEIKDIEGWLRSEQVSGTASEELVIGMGCASSTSRLPKYIVAQHASVFAPKILECREGRRNAGVGINAVSTDGTPCGWNWFDYGGEVEIIPASGEPGWEVRISPTATARISELRTEYGNTEAGGYLYGGYDFSLKQIYIVAASDIPPGTSQSPAAIVLGPAGQTPLEQKILRRTGGRLGRVGTWHTHPNSGPEMSDKDRRTMESFVQADRKNGVPTLLVISSPEGSGAFVWN